MTGKLSSAAPLCFQKVLTQEGYRIQSVLCMLYGLLLQTCLVSNECIRIIALESKAMGEKVGK